MSLDIQPSVVSLFAGIGGFDLGFDHAGFRIVGHVEKDAKCRKLLATKWPDAVALDDVCTAGAHNLPPCDVVTFGFPCQDLSVAGKRAGLAGGRSGLFYEATRIIDELKPAYCLFENVPGLLSSDGGRDFWRVLRQMDEIGYHGAWRTLDAQWFGVAQRRRRVFGLFSRLDSGAERCAKVLSLGESLRGHPAPRREAGKVAPCLAASGVGAGRTGNERNEVDFCVECAPALAASGRGVERAGETRGQDPVVAVPEKVNTLTSRMQGSSGWAPYNETEHLIPEVAGCLQERDAKGPDSDTKPGHLVPVSTPWDAQRARIMDASGTAPTLPSGAKNSGNIIPAVAYREVAPALTGNYGKQPDNSDTALGPNVVSFAQNQLGEVRIGDIAGTVNTNSNASGRNTAMAQVAMSVRRLTPTECCRLQNFPDDWFDGLNFSDSTKYKCLGNAVCVSVAEWIAMRLIKEFK